MASAEVKNNTGEELVKWASSESVRLIEQPRIRTHFKIGSRKSKLAMVQSE